MRILKNRLVIGCVCVILAFLLGFLGLPLIVDRMSDKVQVVVAQQDIESGTQITDRMFRIVEMSVGDLPYARSELYSAISGKGDDCIFNTTAGDVPKYAAADISANDFVSRRKISTTTPYRDKELRELSEDEFAVTVTVNTLDASVAGKIRPGDVVSLLMATSDDETKEAISYNEVRYMEIIGVSTKDGVDITSSASESMPTYATLKCNFRQAKMLAQINSNYKIHMAFAAHASTEKAVELLTAQKEYLAQLDAEEEKAKLEAEQNENNTPADNAAPNSDEAGVNQNGASES